nr:hypothetical protein [uncultured bacterium]
MEYLIGALLSLAIVGLISSMGFDRERSFYPTVMIVIAAYYVLFAAMAAPTRTVIIEIVAGSAFVIMAVIGYKWNLWLVAIALAGHGVFDLFHPAIIEDPGVPRWWPGFCFVCDVVLGGWLAMRLVRRQVTTG